MFVEMVICDFPKGKYTMTVEFIGYMLLFLWEGLQQIKDKALTCMSLHVPKKTTIVSEVHAVHSHNFYSNGQKCCKIHSGGDALYLAKLVKAARFSMVHRKHIICRSS